jgi:hypothetical protein
LRQLFKYLVFIEAIILFSCAQRSALSGGDKDVSPPEILEVLPQNKSVNFSADEINIKFNEFVKLKNIQNQLIVSPIMEELPSFKLKGKKIVIKLQSALNENTTYSINFGDAIVDITEDNPHPNFKYVFSTGNELDSLSYSGVLLDAFDLSPQENRFVMLYKQLHDTIPLKQKPNYLTKTKADGSFSVTNIQQGTYKVFAIDDINGNYLYDLPNEQVAFLTQPIVLDSSITEQVLYAFTKTDTIQYVKKIENKQYGKLHLELNLPGENISIFDENDDAISYSFYEHNESFTKHTFWITDEITTDEKLIIIKQNGFAIDSSVVDFLTLKDFKDTVLNIKDNVASSFDLNQEVLLQPTIPLKELIKEKIKLIEGNKLVETVIEQDTSSLNIRIKYAFKENTNYQLKIDSGAFVSIYKLSNDSIEKSFKTKKEENYGTLKLTVSPNFSYNYILQLWKNDELIEEFFDKHIQVFVVPFLKPDEYQVKLIVDENKNKKWDNGDYHRKLQPERLIIYNDKITIQENWDNDIIWNIKL